MTTTLFPNSPNLSLAMKQQSKKSAKKSKANRRQQRYKRHAQKADSETIIILDEEKNRVKISKKQRRSEKAKYKALVKKLKNDITEKKPKKKKKQARPVTTSRTNVDTLPEEAAYKRSLQLNRKEHAKKLETQTDQKEAHMSLHEKLMKAQNEAAEKRLLTLINGTLPEERAYRLSIGQEPDAYLNPSNCV